MIWSCVENDQCECGDVPPIEKSLIQGRNYSTQPLVQRSLTSSITLPPGLVSEERLTEIQWWYQLVAPFTERIFTHSNDKLPAFSGIAKRFQTECHGSYLAGLWEAHLPLGLLWHHGRSTFPPKRLTRRHEDPEIRLPSWAWSTFAEPIELCQLSRFSYVEAEVLETECILAGRDPTGEIRSGFICLRAPVAMFEIEVLPGIVNKFDCHTAFSLRLDREDTLVPCSFKPSADGLEDDGSVGDATKVHQTPKHSSPKPLMLQILTTDGSGGRREPGLPRRLLVAFLYTDSMDVQQGSQDRGEKEAFIDRLQDSLTPRSLAFAQSPTDPSAYERIGLFQWHPKLDQAQLDMFEAAMEIRDIKSSKETVWSLHTIPLP